MNFSKVIELINSKISRHKELGKYLSWNLFFRVLSVMISLVAGVLISREIGDSNRGIYQLFFTSLMLFNAFLNFGLNSSASYYANKDKEKIRSYLGNNLLLTIASSIFIALSIYLIGGHLNIQSDRLKIIFVLCYFAFSFNAIYRAFLIGIHEILFMLKLDFSLRFIYLLIVIFALKFDILSLNLIFSLYTIELLVFSLYSYRRINIVFFPIRFDFELVKESMFFNLKSFIGSILVLMLMRSDQYLIKYLLNNSNVGIYGVCNTIIENLSILSVVLSTVYLPKFLDIKDYNLVLQKTRKLLLVIVLSGFAISVVIYFLAPTIISFFLKKESVEGANSLRILLVGFIFWSMFGVIYTLYTSQRFKKSILVILLFILFINFGLNYIFIPKYGIIAAAISSSLCYGLLFVLTCFDLFYLKRRIYNRIN